MLPLSTVILFLIAPEDESTLTRIGDFIPARLLNVFYCPYDRRMTFCNKIKQI